MHLWLCAMQYLWKGFRQRLDLVAIVGGAAEEGTPEGWHGVHHLHVPAHGPGRCISVKKAIPVPQKPHNPNPDRSPALRRYDESIPLEVRTRAVEVKASRAAAAATGGASRSRGGARGKGEHLLQQRALPVLQRPADAATCALEVLDGDELHYAVA